MYIVLKEKFIQLWKKYFVAADGFLEEGVPGNFNFPPYCGEIA